MAWECKLFGHKTFDIKNNFYDPAPCQRDGCDYISLGRDIPPMPKVKPVKSKPYKFAECYLWLPTAMGRRFEGKNILLTEKEMVELAETTPISLAEIKSLFGRK